MQEKRLFDKEISDILAVLGNKLSWLTNPYGRVERRRSVKFNKNRTAQTTYYFPAFYTSNGEYLNLLPSDSRCNTCFFYINDAQNVDDNAMAVSLKATANVIFWVDMRTIYDDEDGRYTENVKNDILSALRTCPKVETKRIFEQPENVYKDFTIVDVPTEFTMAPYYAVRFELTLIARQTC